MARRLSISVFVVLTSLATTAWPQANRDPLARYRAIIASSFDTVRVKADIRSLASQRRSADNPGIDSSVAFLRRSLEEIGFEQDQQSTTARYGIQTDVPGQPVWLPTDARFEMTSPEVRLLSSFATTPEMLCRQSFPADINADLVYVPGGAEPQDYDGIDVANRIVLCDAPPELAFTFAVTRHARGVISTYVPTHATAAADPDIVGEGAIPLDTVARSFGLKISPRTGDELRRLLMYTPVSVRIHISTSWSSAGMPTVWAEIPGTVAPEERVIFVAHLDHDQPGATGNAGGSATLLQLARTFQRAIRDGALPSPKRTLTFIWVDEVHGTEAWLRRNPPSPEGAGFVVDGIGADPAKTGGSFHFEKMPDPGFFWFRPPESRTGWGNGIWNLSDLKGHYLNDLVVSAIHGTAAGTDWNAGVGVWEGGANHEPMLRGGVPTVFARHFPNRFAHTNRDRPDKVSARELLYAGVALGSAAWAVASGDPDVAQYVARLVGQAGRDRMIIERENGAFELGVAQTEGADALAEAKSVELDLLTAWKDWYAEALRSTLTMVPGSPPTPLSRLVREELDLLEDMYTQTRAVLDITDP